MGCRCTSRLGWVGLVWVGMTVVLGCTSATMQAPTTRPGDIRADTPVMKNPVVVATDDFEHVWNRAVDVLDDTFPIKREDRRAGRIVTRAIMAAQLLEPWHRDSVTWRDRLDAAMHTLRRRAEVQIARHPSGGYTIEVKVFKEQEIRDTPLFASYGGVGRGGAVTFATVPLSRVPPPDIHYGTPPGEGWFLLGRDGPLEDRLLRDLAHAIP